MTTSCKTCCVPTTIVAIVFIAYFFCYPQDLTPLVAVVEKVLGWSHLISPWLYGLLAVALICWTVLQVCRTRTARPFQQPPNP